MVNWKAAAEAKVILLGEANVGKTSLARKLVDINNSMTQSGEVTKGIEINTIEWDSEDHISYKVNIWDFGGQDKYFSVHNLFMTRNSIYIIAWDPVRSGGIDEYFRAWLDMARHYGGDSPIIVVINKVDEFKMHNKRDIGLYIENKYSNFKEQNIKFVYTSCKDDTGIDELKDKIKEAVQSNESFHMSKDTYNKYNSLKQHLTGLKRSCINKADFACICKEQFEMDENEAAAACEHLVSCGYILNVEKYNLLKDILIIDKNWILDNIYKVLDYQQGNFIFDKDVITRNLLGGLLYNDVNDLFLVMNEIGLCCRLEGSRDRRNLYLIPNLLSSEIPQEAKNRNKYHLKLVYKYDFVKHSYFGSLISKLYKRCDGELFWNSGIYLNHKNERALVVYDNLNYSIKVYVEKLGSKSIVEFIREQINELHYELDGISYREYVACCCKKCSDLDTNEDDISKYDINMLSGRLASGRDYIPCYQGDEDVSLELLKRGVDIDNAVSVKFIFLCYSHDDNERNIQENIHWIDEIRKELEKETTEIEKTFENIIIDVWYDGHIPSGVLWDKKIRGKIESSHMAVLMISDNFFKSPYINEVELPLIMDKFDKGELSCHVVLLRKCDIDEKVNRLQFTHDRNQPLAGDIDNRYSMYKR
ncbi:MAG: COR domain-containing protein, partial [Bacillota bacterium]